MSRPPPHPSLRRRGGVAASGLPQHPATLPFERMVQRKVSEGQRPPHPATEKRAGCGALHSGRPPHPATVQAQSELRSASPPHPATRLLRPLDTLAPPRRATQGDAAWNSGSAQRALASAFTGVNPIPELQTMAEAFRAFAKVESKKIQEVQAMWYRHGPNDGYQLAVAANNTVGDKYAVDAISAGLITTLANTEKHPKSPVKEAKPHLNTSAHLTLASATLVYGRSHAEQNLLAWIAPKLTANSKFYIAGTKDPCSQCQPRLSAYQGRLVHAGYATMFTYHDGGVNQRVEEDDVRDQVDAQALRIP